MHESHANVIESLYQGFFSPGFYLKRNIVRGFNEESLRFEIDFDL